MDNGKKMEYNEDNSPIKFSSYTSYSFNEDCVETFSLQANFYVKQIIGGLYNTFWGTAYELDKFLSSDWKERTYISFYN